MANKALVQNITQAISDFDSIKQAMVSKGVKVPYGTKTSEYAEKIEEISTGTDGSIPLDISQLTDFSYFCYKNRFIDILPNLDTSKGTSFKYMFNECTDLYSIPLFDTSSGINFNHTFFGCADISSIPKFDTSNGTNFFYTFSRCKRLSEITQLDISKGTNFYGMFSNCTNLTTIPSLDTSNGTNFNSMFSNCSSLTDIQLTSIKGNLVGMFYNCSALTYLEVSGTIEISDNYFNLSYSPELTVGSLVNVLRALSDNTKTMRYTVRLGTTNLSKLTDEQKQIAKDKNYLLT